MSIIFMHSPCGLCISWESYLFRVVIHSERTALGKQAKTGLLHIKCIWGAERRSQQGASICHRLLTRLSAVDSFPRKCSHEAGNNGGWRSMGGDLLTEMYLDFILLYFFFGVACDMLGWIAHTGRGTSNKRYTILSVFQEMSVVMECTLLQILKKLSNDGENLTDKCFVHLKNTVFVILAFPSIWK